MAMVGLPDFDDDIKRFEKWEKVAEDIRWRHKLWADKDDCEELQYMRDAAREEMAKRRAEAQAAKA